MHAEHLHDVENYVQQNLAALSEDQLNWQPAPCKWSIAQCLDHLIVTNEKYLPAFESILVGSYTHSFWQRINPFTKKMGLWLVKNISEVPERRFKAPKTFAPDNKRYTASILRDFISHQQKLIPLFAALKKLKTREIVISSPVSSLITLRLKEALMLIVQHEQRHINQANNVLHHSLFPKQ